MVSQNHLAQKDVALWIMSFFLNTASLIYNQAETLPNFINPLDAPAARYRRAQGQGKRQMAPNS
jgi:hypothetical protein